MSRVPGLLALAAGLVAGAAAAEPALTGKFIITNEAHRVVECNLLVDSRTRTYLKVHVGKAYFDNFRASRLLQLACVRGAQDLFGPLKVGVAYRFVDAPGNRVDVVAAQGG